MDRRLRNSCKIVSLLLVLSICSCATFMETSYKGLTISKVGYDATLQNLGELYAEGKISENQQNKIIEIANEYVKLHNFIVESIMVYSQTKDEYQKRVIVDSLKELSFLLEKLRKYLETKDNA